MVLVAVVILAVLFGVSGLVALATTKPVPALGTDGSLTLDTQLSHEDGRRERVWLQVTTDAVVISRNPGWWQIVRLPWSKIEDVEFERRTVADGALEGWPVVGLGITGSDGKEWLVIEEGLGAEKRLQAALKLISPRV